MNEIEISKLVQLRRNLQDALQTVDLLLAGIPRDMRLVSTIEKYYSNSGNLTYRGDCEDGTRVYFRSRDLDKYPTKFVEELESLPFDMPVGVRIGIKTIPDGDFHKVDSVTAWNLDSSGLQNDS